MKKRKTPTKVIESRENPELESAYIKFPRENPLDVSVIRTQKKVYYDKYAISRFKEDKRDQIKEKTGSKFYPSVDYSDIHTHSINLRGYRASHAIPSSGDLKDFLETKSAKTMFIAENDVNNGKILGYTAIRKTKKTPDVFVYEQGIKLKKDLEKYREEIIGWPATFSALKSIIGIKGDSTKPLKNILDQYALQYRFVPSEGCYFNRHLGSFVPKPSSKLETKVAVGIIGFLVLSLLFVNNLTGFAIASEPNKPEFNIFLVVVFILSTLFLVIKKRTNKNLY